MAIEKLLFVDANIWLDFYRARTDAGLKLLGHLEAISESIIVTHQLEMEFKKNRQHAILEGMKELKSPDNVPRLGIFSDAQATKSLTANIKYASDRVKKLKRKLGQALDNPAGYDPVYQTVQRIFHQDSGLILKRSDPIRRQIRSRAFKRFIVGCPPRKKSDTSIGDAINWEWMVECAIRNAAELVIVTRDSDYGIVHDNKAYINDHLRQEFSERVSKKRKILLYSKLSEALKHFEVAVTPQEEAEEEIITSGPSFRKTKDLDIQTDAAAVLEILANMRLEDVPEVRD